jgi:hypothetical protein
VKKRERDVETWKDIVLEIEWLLSATDGRTHGRLMRGWLLDQHVALGLDTERAGKEDE